MIAPTEYQLAILTIISEAVAIERDDLVVETANLANAPTIRPGRLVAGAAAEPQRLPSLRAMRRKR
jgi:hypothetical protein